MSALIRHVLRWMEVDRAVSYGIMAVAVGVLGTPITMVLITRSLTPVMQGFYYTFASILALQSFIELGLCTVVVNAASHEWTRLQLNERGAIVGDENALSRLVSLGRFVFHWYAIGIVLFVAGVGMGGYLFFSRQAAEGVHWVGPWWLLVVLSGLVFWAVPFGALLEGCNQVTTIQRFRFTQVALQYAGLWVTFLLGGQLWAAAAATGVVVLRHIYLLGFQYRNFFQPFFSRPSGARIHWRTELWPMQWRLAVSDTSSFFLMYAFTPVMFHYHGAVVAGRMGMTMSAVFMLQGLIVRTWLPPKVPRFGMLIAGRDYDALDRLWWRTTRASVVVVSAGCAAAWLVVYGLNVLGLRLAGRLLSPSQTALLLLATVFVVVGYCETVYLRAHKREPLMVLNVVTSLLMGLLVWGLGSRFGPTGAAVAYLLVVAVVSLPWETAIWLRRKAEWHGPSERERSAAAAVMIEMVLPLASVEEKR